MNPGTLKTNSIKPGIPNERPQYHGPGDASHEDVNMFLDSIARALHEEQGEGMPEIEAPRKIIEYYNRGSINGFEKAGYFIFQGVKVFEDGKKAERSHEDKISCEQKVFGKAK